MEQGVLLQSEANWNFAGILQTLLNFPEFLKENPHTELDVKRSVDFFFEIQKMNYNFPCAMDENHQMARSETKDLIHWCHGASGK